MTAEELSGAAMVLISLILAYLPAVKDWYAARTSEEKATIFAVALLVVTVAVFGTSCVGWDLGATVTCDQKGAQGLIKVFLAALAAGASTYVSLVRPFEKRI